MISGLGDTVWWFNAAILKLAQPRFPQFVFFLQKDAVYNEMHSSSLLI